MHLAIACLGRGTPVGCVSYKDHKFEGLFRHFGIEGVIADPALCSRPGAFAAFIESIARGRHELRKRIRARLRDVEELSEQNLG